MGLLPQLMPIDVLVLHCPLCTFHSHLLNSIEQHFDDAHPAKMIDYIIYRCTLCHKVASCRHFMHEHITLIHNKPMTLDQTGLVTNTTDTKSTSPDSSDLYSSIAYISIYFSGKLYSKSQKSNASSSDNCRIQQSPDTRPCSRAISDVTDPIYKCIFCKSLHHSFQQLQLHYVQHGIRNLGNQSIKDEIVLDETSGSCLSEKALNIVDNEENEDDEKVKGFCKTELKEMYNIQNNHCADADSISQDDRSVHSSTANNCMSIEFLSQSPLKSFNQISTSLQNRSSLFNLILQQSANQSPQSLSTDEKVSPQSMDNFCSVGLSLPFPISNKVASLTPRLNSNNWFGGLNPSQLITSPILSSLHSQFGLPSLHQHMMNAYAAVNGTNPSISASNAAFNCTSPNTLLSGPNLMSTNVEMNNPGNTPSSPTFSTNDLFQVPKGFPSVFSSVMNGNGTNQMNASVDNSIDLSSNNSKKNHDKIIMSSSESDRSSLSLSPTDKYVHATTRNQHNEHSEPSSVNNDSNNVDESQIYSMKRVVGLSRTNLPFQARKILFGWLTSHLREPYPSEEEKIRLANETGLSRTTVNNWFINARRRYVKPLLQGKLGMTSGVLKSMLDNNNGIMHNQRNQFTPNVISSGLKRKSMLDDGEHDELPTVRRRSNNNTNAGKSANPRCVDQYIPDSNVRVKFEEKLNSAFPTCDIVESSKENRVIIDMHRSDSANNSDYNCDSTAKDQNTIPCSYKIVPQELSKGTVETTVNI